MNLDCKELSKELGIIVAAALVIGYSVSMFDRSLMLSSIISFFIILLTNLASKKIVAYNLESDIKTRFWAWEYYWFGSYDRFKKPIPMIWIPLFASLLTKANLFWLAVLEYDITPRTERVSKRHGLYRFSQMTDWHISLITGAGVVANLVLAFAGYLIGFEYFARLSIYFALWSLIPISSLDGSKILFGSRILWVTLVTAMAILLSYGIIIS